MNIKQKKCEHKILEFSRTKSAICGDGWIGDVLEYICVACGKTFDVKGTFT